MEWLLAGWGHILHIRFGRIYQFALYLISSHLHGLRSSPPSSSSSSSSSVSSEVLISPESVESRKYSLFPVQQQRNNWGSYRTPSRQHVSGQPSGSHNSSSGLYLCLLVQDVILRAVPKQDVPPGAQPDTTRGAACRCRPGHDRACPMWYQAVDPLELRVESLPAASGLGHDIHQVRDSPPDAVFPWTSRITCKVFVASCSNYRRQRATTRGDCWASSALLQAQHSARAR